MTSGAVNGGGAPAASGQASRDGEQRACGTFEERGGPRERSRPREPETLRDLCDADGFYDDEDDGDSDSDWEPAPPRSFTGTRWFCVNCTMPNLDDVSQCDVCGEYKNSEILLRGCFASTSLGEGSQGSFDLNLAVRLPGSVEHSTAIGFDERMLLHSEVEMKSQPHPERPDRLRAISASLSTAGIYPEKCFLIPSREITEEELRLVHSLDHVEAVRCTSHFLSSYFTPDTYANEHSALSARLAAGFCSDLAVAIMSGKVKNGFALVRPPGHHAGVKQAMGFCLHNNAAIAAKAALSAGAEKILIVDWDVHHGNGTQEIFVGNKSVLYVSLHRHENGRFYPGSGAADEVGIMDGEGFSVNIPWKNGGVGDNDYIFAFQNIVLPIGMEFSPDLTIISAGFDAATGDPLGGCDVTPAGFAQMTYMLSSLSEGKTLVILEGGYNLRSISSSATSVIKILLGSIPMREANEIVPSRSGLEVVLAVLKIHSKYWSVASSNYLKIKAKWRSSLVFRRGKPSKQRRLMRPIWWKWGTKRFMFRVMYGRCTKLPRHRKIF